MLVTAILLASLNFSTNPFYYRAAGIAAILFGLTAYGIINKQSSRIESLENSKRGNLGSDGSLFVLHLAFPTILMLGGVAVLISATI